MDFTTNPLIALYFACDGDEKKDARVVSQLIDDLWYQDDSKSIVIEAICSLHKIMIVDDLKIEEWLNHYSLTLSTYLLYIYVLSYNRSLVIRPKYWNERQKL